MKSAIVLFLITAAITQAQLIDLFNEPIDVEIDPFRSPNMSEATISIEDAYNIAEKEVELPNPTELFAIIEAQSNQIKPTKIEISTRSCGVGSIVQEKPIRTLSWYVVELGLKNKKWVHFAVLEDRTIIWGKEHAARTNR